MKRMIITAAAVLSVIAACNKTSMQNHIPADTAELEVDVRTGFTSKAMITSGTLENGSEVGVSLFGSDGNLYDGIQYRNIRYTAQNSSSSQSQSSSYLQSPVRSLGILPSPRI